MTPEEHAAFFGRPDDLPLPPVEVKWSRMTVTLPTGRVLVFYEDDDIDRTLIAHEFTIYGEE